jgi:hypothetical protein
MNGSALRMPLILTPGSLLFFPRFDFAGQPARLAQSLTQNEFDLRIETAQIIIRPALHSGQGFLVYSQRKCFA